MSSDCCMLTRREWGLVAASEGPVWKGGGRQQISHLWGLPITIRCL